MCAKALVAAVKAGSATTASASEIALVFAKPWEMPVASAVSPLASNPYASAFHWTSMNATVTRTGRNKTQNGAVTPCATITTPVMPPKYTSRPMLATKPAG